MDLPCITWTKSLKRTCLRFTGRNQSQWLVLINICFSSDDSSANGGFEVGALFDGLTACGQGMKKSEVMLF